MRDAIDFENLKRASQINAQCGTGIGLYIGPEGSPEYKQMIDTHFRREGNTYQIDLTKFKCRGKDGFAEYNGIELPRFDGTQSIFNGIIFVEGQVHVWGIMGGRSNEDYFVIDKEENPDPEQYYPGTDGAGNNTYSNNFLDRYEDDNKNGYLDAPGGSCNLLIVTSLGSSLYIDHNIFQPAYPNWKNHKLFLLSGGTMHLSASSPKTTIIEASLIVLGKHNGLSFIIDDESTGKKRIDNYWAKTRHGSYEYDLNADGKFSWDNNEGQPEDRNEFSMKNAHALIIRGNLIMRGQANFGEYFNDNHIVAFIYDEALTRSYPACFPAFPLWKAVISTIKTFPEEE